MLGFIDTLDGGAINVAHVVRLRRPTGDRSARTAVVAELSDGGTAEISWTAADRLERSVVTYLPASEVPGLRCMLYWKPDAADPRHLVEFVPIIGWMVALYGTAYPILPGMSTDDADDWAIVLPSGKVEVPDDGTYESVEVLVKRWDEAAMQRQ